MGSRRANTEMMPASSTGTARAKFTPRHPHRAMASPPTKVARTTAVRLTVRVSAKTRPRIAGG